MSKIVICITNDIDYDRRIRRTRTALSEVHDVEVLSRRIYKSSGENKIICWFKKGFLFYAEYNIRLFWILLFKKFDVAVAVDFDTIIPVVLASKLRSKKIVFDAHEYFEESMEITHRAGVKKFWTWVGKRFVPQVDRAYTVCNSIAKIYNAKFAMDFKVIRNVPSTLKIESIRDDTSRKIILYQGALNEGRKLEMLIDAASYLSEEYVIWIIGEGDISTELKSRSNDKVVFHSWVDPERLATLTSKAFLAYNLLDNTSLSYYYSLANKFFDYIHAGVPSINSPFPEYNLYNERYNCCFIADVKDSQQLASLIVQLDQDRTLWREKRKNSFLAAVDLNWEKEQKKLLKIYDFHRNTSI